MKFLIVAAKTGGHVFPASAIAKSLVKNNYEVVFIGTGTEIEKSAYEELDSKIYNLSIEGFRGSNLIIKFKVIYQIFVNIFKVIKIIKEDQIDAMIGFGGFITVPSGIACWLTRKPIFLHEQNAVLGSANKLLSKISKINFIGFPIKGLKRAVLSGNPIRDFFNDSQKNYIGKDNEEIKIYITGGSQGAEYINQTVPLIFKNLPYELKIRHQCGKDKLEKVKDLYKSNEINAEVNEFYKNPNEQIIWSDFVISRAGAISLSEITSLKRGVVMIPLPTSIDNHQLWNAKSIEGISMGILHEQKEHINHLQKKVDTLIKNKVFISWKNTENLDHINSAKIIIANIEDFFENNEII
tara:strand:- start:23 stop:1081 length:1059 start_codon:yes stop_codon:yes gene_type:complete